MKYVTIDGMLDPREYEQRLPEFAGALPPGARAFAADPDHYYFVSKRCVKDLALERISVGQDSLELYFRHNCWKHDDDLVIRYEGVFELTIDVASLTYGGIRPVVILDEVLPHPDGCSHEIAFRPGTIQVLCRDLVATWVESNCPDKS